MAHRFLMDVHVPLSVTLGLRQRGVDVTTAQEAGLTRASDETLLSQAEELGCILFTQDDDLLAIGAARNADGREFCGIVYAHQLGPGIGEMIEDLELLALCANKEELRNQIIFLPLK